MLRPLADGSCAPATTVGPLDEHATPKQEFTTREVGNRQLVIDDGEVQGSTEQSMFVDCPVAALHLRPQDPLVVMLQKTATVPLELADAGEGAIGPFKKPIAKVVLHERTDGRRSRSSCTFPQRCRK